jgi:hypothetical protein
MSIISQPNFTAGAPKSSTQMTAQKKSYCIMVKESTDILQIEVCGGWVTENKIMQQIQTSIWED